MPVTTVSALALNQAVGSGGSLSMLDKKLLKFAQKRLSPQEIADRLGGIVTPAEAAQRVREILRSMDWLAITEQRALILLDMIELKEILFDRVRAEGGIVTDHNGDTAFSFGDPRWTANLQKLLGEMNKLISSEQLKVDVERQGIRRVHADVMVRALEAAFGIVARNLMAQYPQVQEAHLRDMLEEAMPQAILMVDQATDEEDRDDDLGGF